MYMIPRTVLPKPNLILAHPLDTASTILKERHNDLMKVDFCKVHMEFS